MVRCLGPCCRGSRLSPPSTMRERARGRSVRNDSRFCLGADALKGLRVEARSCSSREPAMARRSRRKQVHLGAGCCGTNPQHAFVVFPDGTVMHIDPELHLVLQTDEGVRAKRDRRLGPILECSRRDSNCGLRVRNPERGRGGALLLYKLSALDISAKSRTTHQRVDPTRGCLSR